MKHSEEQDRFQVESGVPLPDTGVAKSEYPWWEMSPGDSFFIPATGEDFTRVRRSVASAGYNWCKRNRPSWTCHTRRVDGGLRVWLVEKNGGGA